MNYFTVSRLDQYKLNYKNLIKTLGNGKIMIDDDLKVTLLKSINQNGFHKGTSIIKMGLVKVNKSLPEGEFGEFGEYFQKEVLERRGLRSVSLIELLFYKQNLWRRKKWIGTLGWHKESHGKCFHPLMSIGFIQRRKVTLVDPFVFSCSGVFLAVKENEEKENELEKHKIIHENRKFPKFLSSDHSQLPNWLFV